MTISKNIFVSGIIVPDMYIGQPKNQRCGFQLVMDVLKCARRLHAKHPTLKKHARNQQSALRYN